MRYGCAMASTGGQSVDPRVRQLTKAGCKKVFREVVSGAKTDRAQLRKVFREVVSGAKTDRAQLRKALDQGTC